MSTHILLRNGALFDYCDEQTWANLDIHAIAWSLAHQHRYLGHTRYPYNTAAHAVRVSYMVPASFALEGLLHDAAEAVCGDMPNPLKRLPELASYAALEERVLAHVLQRHGLAPVLSDVVHAADYQAFREEVAALAVNQSHKVWGFDTTLYREPRIPVVLWDSTASYKEFLHRYTMLTETAA
jgi:hypothetical protein